jgi:hypothetical protein
MIGAQYVSYIVGLTSVQEISVNDITPVWLSILNENFVDAGQFSLWLNRTACELNGGELVLGGHDPSHFSGPVAYQPLSKDGYWQFKAARSVCSVRLSPLINQ